MIVLDIETSGGKQSPSQLGVWQIGALELENPKNTFFQEGHIDSEDLVEEGAILVTGRSEKEMRNPKLQSQKELIENFLTWASKIEDQTLICHNPQFDYGFIWVKSNKYKINLKVPYRAMDLHTLSVDRIFKTKGILPKKDNQTAVSLKDIIEFCSLKDERIQLKETTIVKQGSPHNALEDAKLEAECFSRLVYGKNLLPEFKEFPIPDYLKQ